MQLFGKLMKTWIKISTIFSGLMITLSFNLTAAEKVSDFELVKAKLQAGLGLQISSIGDAPVTGLLQIMTEKGLFYTSQDGKYLLQARIYDVEEGMRNLTEEALGSVRLGGLENSTMRLSNTKLITKSMWSMSLLISLAVIVGNYMARWHNITT